jgi:quinol monooxygenase YgiN
MHVTIAMHYPNTEHSDAFFAFMKRVQTAMQGTPGLASFESFRDVAEPRLVAIARWESPEAFLAAMPRLRAVEGRDPSWSARPDELLRLDSEG